MRILIAEDDPALANFVRKGLEAEHYAVDVSADGEQARAMAGEFDFDLVVLDLNLPRLDGVSILRFVRTRKPSMPILVLFAGRLNNLCKVSVREAAHNELIEPGVVYIAPAGQHMTTQRRTPSQVAIHLSYSPEGMLHVPSVDVMMLSVAEVFRSRSMGIIMTGMGADGVQGMQAIKREGGLTVGQDEASCTVYGMPRSCAEGGVLQRVVSLIQIPEQILQATQYRRRA